MILGSSYGATGSCYIETGALDGEKNLKPKSAIVETAQYFMRNTFKQHYESRDLLLGLQNIYIYIYVNISL